MKLHIKAGFTLIEISVVLAIIGVLTLVAVPAWQQWQDNQRVKDASISVVKAFTLARSEAVRTGKNHIVFFQSDAENGALIDIYGDAVPILVVDDQLPGTADQNCKIDAGEAVVGIPSEDGVNWGVTNANVVAPSDAGGAPMASGLTFTETGTIGGTAANWVLFNPRGLATPFRLAGGGCTLGGAGSGGGAVYITNGVRDYAVVVNGLGAVHIHAWEEDQGAWSN